MSTPLPKDKWVWMPHAAHFIGADHCRFHLATWVGDFIVSTVGEYMPDSAVRAIIARSNGSPLTKRGDEQEIEFFEKFGWADVGDNRKYETMVFKAQPSEHKCCPYEMADCSEVDYCGYNSADEAYAGHVSLCEKWSKIDQQTLGTEDLEANE